MDFDLNYTLLSTQTALLGNITPSLRAVTIHFEPAINCLTVHFFYDGKITDELFEIASCVCTEIEICHPPILFNRNSDIIIRLDCPQKIPIKGRLVYLREEPLSLKYSQKPAASLCAQRFSPMTILLLDVQEALLGRVVPSLRSVSINMKHENKHLSFYFVYDGVISEKQYQLTDEIIEKGRISFPEYQVQRQIERIDFPAKLPALGSRIVFQRNENI